MLGCAALGKASLISQKCFLIVSGIRRELPDPARGSGLENAAAGQTSQLGSTPATLQTGSIRQPVGGSICKLATA